MHPLVPWLLALLAGGPASSRSPAMAPPREARGEERTLVFDRRGDRALEGVLFAAAETTPPLEGWTLFDVGPLGRVRLADRVGAALITPEGSVLAIRAGTLVELTGAGERALATGLAPELAIDRTGRVLAVVRPAAAGEGESALELLDRQDGRTLRRIVPGDGWNNAPLFTPDGRAVLFVSTRTGVSSLFQVGVDGKGLRQLTNVGLSRASEGYVPPPERTAERRFVGGAFVWGSAADRWSLDLARAKVRRLAPGEAP